MQKRAAYIKNALAERLGSFPVYKNSKSAYRKTAYLYGELIFSYEKSVPDYSGAVLPYDEIVSAYTGGFLVYAETVSLYEKKGALMFTSMELDDDLVFRALSTSGIKTKKALVEEALRVYLRLQEQAGVRGLRGKLAWDRDLEKIRGERLADPR